MCGTAQWEWDEDRFAYEPVEKFCQGCYLTASADDPDPNRNKDGITIQLLPTRTIEAARRYVREQKRYEERARQESDKSRFGL